MLTAFRAGQASGLTMRSGLFGGTMAPVASVGKPALAKLAYTEEGV